MTVKHRSWWVEQRTEAEWPGAISRPQSPTLTSVLSMLCSQSEYFGVGLNFTVLNDLIPYWKYSVTARCATTHHLWKWSDWSATVNFHTRGDGKCWKKKQQNVSHNFMHSVWIFSSLIGSTVPDALDVWRQPTDDQTIILWKVSQMSGSLFLKPLEVSIKWVYLGVVNHPLLLSRRKKFIRTQALKCRDKRLEITFTGIYFRTEFLER